MTMQKRIYRHGDLVIEATGEPVCGKALKPGARGHVLAEGEATGHAHRIEDASGAALYRGPDNDNGARLLVVRRPVVLRHEEHGEIRLPRGKYRVRVKRQFAPWGWQQVAD